MKKLKYKPLLLLVVASMLVAAGVWLFPYCRAKDTHWRRPIVSFANAKPVLEARAGELPPELKEQNEGKWKTWAQHEDNVVRTRLEQGALDSMINLLLFGTSFTTQPRVITMNDFGDPVVQARVTDLLEALRNPGNNERIIFIRNLLRSRGADPENSGNYEQTKNFVLENLRRVVQQQNIIREQFDQAGRESNQETALSERSRVFRERGISLDTTILSSFGIEGALRDMKERAVLPK
jgi:hypothetical protein